MPTKVTDSGYSYAFTPSDDLATWDTEDMDFNELFARKVTGIHVNYSSKLIEAMKFEYKNDLEFDSLAEEFGVSGSITTKQGLCV
jgi:hypothetical protein